MDRTDEEILEILEQDGRISFTEVAEKVDVSEGTVRNRIEKMQETGVIEKFTVEISTEGSNAVVMVELETGRDIEKVLEDFPDSIKILEVAGDYDLVLRIERKSNREINSLLDSIRSISGVKDTETYMVLNQRS